MTSAPDDRPDDHPVEVPPEQRGTIRAWVHLLAGPTIFMTHFGAIYLLAEASCAADRSPRMDFLALGVLRVVVVDLTVLAAAGTAVAAWRSFRRFRGARAFTSDMGFIGLLLAIGSFIGVLAVGVPALVLEPC